MPNAPVKHVSVDIVVGTIAGLLVMGIVWSYSRVRKCIDTRPFTQVWEEILGDETDVPIVVGDIKSMRFPIQGQTVVDVPLPPNVPLIGIQDAMAAAELKEALASGAPPRKSRIIVRGELKESSFVVLGGPSINETAYELVQRFDEADGVFHSSKDVLDKKFVMRYPSHQAEDRTKQKKDRSGPLRYEATIENGKVMMDYGFILIGPNPYNPKKRACVVLGLWPHGTYAAIQALIHPDNKTEKERELLEKIKEGRDILAVVQTSVNELSPGYPRVVDVRDLSK